VVRSAKAALLGAEAQGVVGEERRMRASLRKDVENGE